MPLLERERFCGWMKTAQWVVIGEISMATKITRDVIRLVARMKMCRNRLRARTTLTLIRHSMTTAQLYVLTMAVAAMTIVLGAEAEDEALVLVEGGERLHAAVVVVVAAAARLMTVVVGIIAIARSTNIR
jgi:hypothetical protein